LAFLRVKLSRVNIPLLQHGRERDAVTAFSNGILRVAALDMVTVHEIKQRFVRDVLEQRAFARLFDRVPTDVRDAQITARFKLDDRGVDPTQSFVMTELKTFFAQQLRAKADPQDRLFLIKYQRPQNINEPALAQIAHAVAERADAGQD